MPRIAVLVSGGGTNLQALIDAAGRGEMPAEIAVVVSSASDAYALERAKKHGIESRCILPKDYESKARYEAALIAFLQEKEVDLIVLAGFLFIFSAGFVRAFEGRIINVHPSLIPAFAGPGCYGLKVHEAALARGVKITGATVHVVTADVDGGPILLQKAVDVHSGDTPETLQRRVMAEAEHVILPQAVCEMIEQVKPATL